MAQATANSSEAEKLTWLTRLGRFFSPRIAIDPLEGWRMVEIRVWVARLAILVCFGLAVLIAYYVWSFPLVLALSALLFSGGVYFYFWWHRNPIRLKCDACQGVILSNTPWICECGFKIANPDTYALLKQCPECGKMPKAYECHHKTNEGNDCKTYLFFSEDKDRNSVARRLVLKEDEFTKTQKDTAQTHELERQKKKHEIELVEMEVLRAFHKARERVLTNVSLDNGSVVDAMAKAFTKYRDKHVSVGGLVQRLIENAQRDHAGDPIKLQMEMDIIHGFEKEMLEKESENPRSK